MVDLDCANYYHCSSTIILSYCYSCLVIPFSYLLHSVIVWLWLSVYWNILYSPLILLGSLDKSAPPTFTWLGVAPWNIAIIMLLLLGRKAQNLAQCTVMPPTDRLHTKIVGNRGTWKQVRYPYACQRETLKPIDNIIHTSFSYSLQLRIDKCKRVHVIRVSKIFTRPCRINSGF